MPDRTEYRDRIGRAAKPGLAFLLCLALAGLASAQPNAAPADAAGSVTFRTGTELVQVDAIVQKYGRPVDDLTRDDFTLTDNGKPETMGRYLKGIPGRKNLVWIGGGVPMTMQGEKNRLAIFAEYYRVAPILEAPIPILNDANVGVYPIDTAGLSRNLDENSLAPMNYFADNTGGKAVYGISQRMIGHSDRLAGVSLAKANAEWRS